MNIRGLKSLVGEDLIGDITENLDGSVTIKKPMLVMINGNGQGGFAISLFPYMPFAEKREFTYTRSQYLYLFDAVADLKNEYIRINSNLVIPTPETTPSGLKLM